MPAQSLTSRDLTDADLTRRIERAIRDSISGRILLDEPLARHTSWRVGGPAKFYVYPDSLADLATLSRLCRSLNLATFTIGYGTNLLASDGGFAGCVIDLADGAGEITLEGGTLHAGGGVWLGELVRFASEHRFSGLEKLAGIPGGVGGALQMNAGAFGKSISDHLLEVTGSTPAGDVATLVKDQIGFGYRVAPGLKEVAVFTAQFAFPEGEPTEILRGVEETIAERHRRNVMTLPSAGSVFKNPPGGFAAKMVEAVGAKGMREGGVEVSGLHANFIVNTRGGSAADILNLIRRIRGLVRAKFGALLDLEVRTIGFEGELDLG